MTEPKSRKPKKKRATSPYRDPPPPQTDAADDSEARIGEMLAWAVPLATGVGAIAVGVLFSIGPAILVAVGGAILGCVMLLWGSVRTLTGDAPLGPALASASILERASDLHERKRRVLRALKDLEHEHSVGKIDDEDFERLSDQYRNEAKDVLRLIDDDVEPRRDKAESIVRDYLEKQGTLTTSASGCPTCGTENDEDAAFCKKCGEKLDAA